MIDALLSGRNQPHRPARAIPRGERGTHILELLTARQPRSTDELGRMLKLRPTAIGSTLAQLERQRLVRRAFQGRGRGENLQKPPTLWALREWNAEVCQPEGAKKL